MNDQQKRQTELPTDFFTLEWPQDKDWAKNLKKKVCKEGGKIITMQKGIFW
jgi:hypothetical protein